MAACSKHLQWNAGAQLSFALPLLVASPVSFVHGYTDVQSQNARKRCKVDFNNRFSVFAFHSRARVLRGPAPPEILVKQLSGCRANGGRYWQIVADLADYFAYVLRGTDAFSDCPQCAEHLKSILRATGQAALMNTNYGFCAPSVCDFEQIIELQSHHLEWLYGVNATLPLLTYGLQQVVELSSWSELSLDFVIAGVDMCGVNSITNNLGAFRDIHVALNYHFGSYTLPHKEWVDELEMEFVNAGSPKIRGLVYGTLFRSRLQRQVFALLPNVRVVMIVLRMSSCMDQDVHNDSD